MGRMTSERLDAVAERLATVRARQQGKVLADKYRTMTAAELAQAWDEVMGDFDAAPLRPAWRNLTTAQLTAIYRKLCEVE
jgi:hypothetical protein